MKKLSVCRGFMSGVYVNVMLLQHCVKSVNDALSQLDGVIDIQVDLENKTALAETLEETNEREINCVFIAAGY